VVVGEEEGSGEELEEEGEEEQEEQPLVYEQRERLKPVFISRKDRQTIKSQELIDKEKKDKEEVV